MSIGLPAVFLGVNGFVNTLNQSRRDRVATGLWSKNLLLVTSTQQSAHRSSINSF